MGLEVKKEDFGIEGEFITDDTIKEQGEALRKEKDQLKEKLSTYENLRLEANKKANKVYIFLIPLVIVIAIIGIQYPPLFFVAFVLLIIGLTYGQKEMKKVSKMLKEDLISKVIADTFENSQYSIKEGVNLGEVMQPNMIHRPDRYSSEDMITATYKNIKFLMSDIKLEDRHTTTDSNGHTRTTYQTYFKGKFVKIDLIRDLNLTLKLYEKSTFGFFQGALSGLEKIETESIAFNKKFKTLATSQQDAFYVLTPQLQEKFIELENKFRGSIYFCFQNGYFYCMINDGSDGLEVNPRKPIDDKWLKGILSEISLAATMIEEFHFDSDKWINKDR